MNFLSLSQRFEVAKMLTDKRTPDISESTGASTARIISRVNRSSTTEMTDMRWSFPE